MWTRRYLISLLLIVLFSLCAIAQKKPQILFFEELDQDGGSHILDSKPFIVDINSTLKIDINKDSLREKTTERIPDSSIQELLERARILLQAAEKGMQVIQPLQEVLKDWADPSKRDLVKLKDILSRAAKIAGGIIVFAPRGSTLREELNKALDLCRGKSITCQYRTVFLVASGESERLISELNTVLNDQGISYQLGAWIVSNNLRRPIHVPGFDIYSEGKPYEVPRWILQLSAEQKQTLDELKRKAISLNEDGLEKEFKNIVKSLPSFILDAISSSESCVVGIEDLLENLAEKAKNDLTVIQGNIDKDARNIRGFREFILRIKSKYENYDPATYTGLPKEIIADFNELKSRLLEIVGTIQDIEKFAGDLISKEKYVEECRALKEKIETCLSTILKGAMNNIENVWNIIAGLDGIKQIDTNVFEFGEEVLKHDIDSLPSETSISLINSGVRKSGDVMVIKIAMVRPENPRIDLEAHQIQLHQVLSHINMVVGLIAASPISTKKVDKEFQFAPSYSMLYRWGSRKSPWHNRFFTPGIGLNVATLDFNNDNSPEFGVGVVLSFFRDIIQFGAGYNLNEKVAYGFFGINLPLVTLPIHGKKEN